MVFSAVKSYAIVFMRNQQLWWIQAVYVHPQQRRKGCFRQLYEHVKQLALSQAAGGLRLYADSANARAHTTVSISHQRIC